MRSSPPRRDAIRLHLQPGDDKSQTGDDPITSDTIALDEGNGRRAVEEVTPTEIDMVFAALAGRLLELFHAKSK